MLNIIHASTPNTITKAEVISNGISIILLAKFFISMYWLKKDDTKVFGLRNWKTVVVIYQFGEEWEQTCVWCGQDRKSKGNQVGISNRLLDIREGIQG